MSELDEAIKAVAAGETRSEEDALMDEIFARSLVLSGKLKATRQFQEHVSKVEFLQWLDSIATKAMQPPKDKMTYHDDGECITIYNSDGTMHAHFGPNSAKAVREALLPRAVDNTK